MIVSKDTGGSEGKYSLQQTQFIYIKFLPRQGLFLYTKAAMGGKNLQSMSVSTILQLLQTGSILLGIFVALSTLRGRKDQEVSKITEIQTDIRYIKEKVSEIDRIDRRLTVAEEAIKHHAEQSGQG